jgi:beta-lactamase regulating signal transducer with metallopeptidase domain
MDLLIQVGAGNAIIAAALAVPAALAGWVGRRPALTHALWLLVLLKLLTPPFYPLQLNAFKMRPFEPASVDGRAEDSPPARNETREQIGELDAAMPPPALAEPPRNVPAVLREPKPIAAGVPELEPGEPISWKAVVVTIWLAGSVTWFGLASVRVLRFHRMLRDAREADDELMERARALSAALGLSEPPAVWLIPGRVSPMLWALAGRAVLILPRELLGRLTIEQCDALLTHELAHLRRRDHWVRVLEFLATGLCWWHPILWWARREIREAEEQCCDAWVVWALPALVRGYALALVETVDFVSEVRPALPPVASGVGYVHDLRRRMTMIMRGTTPRGLTWSGVVLVLGVAAFMLPMLPTLAQSLPPTQGGGSSPEDDVKRAAEELQKAKARLGQAQREREKKTRDELDATMKPGLKNDICLRCHQNPHPEISEGKERFENLHDEIVKLTTTLEHQRADIKATEAHLQAALKKLDELSRSKEDKRPRQPESPPPGGGRGGPLPPDGGPLLPPGGGLPGGGPFPPPGGGLPGSAPFPPGGGPMSPGQGAPMKPGGARGAPGDLDEDKRNDELRAEQKKRMDLEKHNQERIQELTNQMEKLIKEMEKMRKELRDRAPEKPPKEVGRPSGGSRPDEPARRTEPAKP